MEIEQNTNQRVEANAEAQPLDLNQNYQNNPKVIQAEPSSPQQQVQNVGLSNMDPNSQNNPNVIQVEPSSPQQQVQNVGLSNMDPNSQNNPKVIQVEPSSPQQQVQNVGLSNMDPPLINIVANSNSIQQQQQQVPIDMFSFSNNPSNQQQPLQQQQQQQQQQIQQPPDFFLNNNTIKHYRQNNQVVQSNTNQNTTIGEKYDDDDEIHVNLASLTEILEKKKYDFNKGLSLQLKSYVKKIKLSQTESKKLPILLTMKTLDSTQENYEVNLEDMNINERASVDLIVVIDHSGSMSGEKMMLVNSTLKYLLEILNEKDRLCLIMFDHSSKRLTPLKKNTKENRNYFTQHIDSIHAQGNTDICLGIEMGLKQIKERKYQNQVTSIFLLSDGLDGGADKKIEPLLKKYNIQDAFTINTFGLGDDHDENLMKGIANSKDGSFYYIQNFSLVNACFIDALGGLMSVIGQFVQYKAQIVANNPFNDLRVSNNFGLWKFNEETKTFTLTQNQILSGISKDYVFEINIPPIKQALTQEQKTNVKIFETELTVQEIYGDKATKNFSAVLFVDFVDNEEEFKQNNEPDQQVLINYLRVNGAQALEKAKQLAQIQQFDQAQKILQEVIDQITESSVKDDPALVLLIQDLQKSKQSCTQYDFYQYGQKYMTSRQQCHQFQQSSVQQPMFYMQQQQQFNNQNNTIQLNQQQPFQNLSQQNFQSQPQMMQQQQQQQQFDPYSNTIQKKFMNQLRQNKQ